MSIPDPGNLAGQMRDYQQRNPMPAGGVEILIAALEMTKDKLGIVDKAERSISDPNIQRDALWKYEASANKPLLGHLLGFIPVETDIISVSDESYKSYLAELENSLPAEIKARMNYESTIPFQDRNPEFQEFHNALVFIATSLAWLDGVTTLHQVNESELARSQISKELPVVALKSMLFETTEILGAAKDYLIAVGPNNPNFDKLINYLTQIGGAREKLNEFSENITSSEISPDDIKSLKKLSEELQNLKTVIQHTDIGNELRILEPTLVALTAISAALCLDHGSSTLAVGLSIANHGISQRDSSLGVIGEAFLNSTGALSASLQEHLVSSGVKDPGAAMFFPDAINTILLGFAIGVTRLSETGFGIIPGNAEQRHTFSMELFLNFICSAGLLETAFESVAKASGANEENAGVISRILSTFAIFFSALNASRGDEDELKTMLSSVKSHFDKGLDSTEGYLDQSINNGDITGDLGERLHSLVLHAKSSLENDDIQGFIGAYTDALGNLGINGEAIDKDLKNLRELTQTLTNALAEDSDTERHAFEGYVQF